ncbi:MAG: polysaccharide pyruvyl transferase family protein [Clostridia bacterium]|nr:polysaccharide pyruvyl transferase family protein [Clostridia bacterium]
MLYYGLAWHPHSDNAGSDLLALAASRLLPRVDVLLDADALDAPLARLAPDDRVVALLPGVFLRSSAHWPPEEHIAPVCVGVHISEEDAWGLPLATLDGAGRRALESCAPIGCRDARTAQRLRELGIPNELTACLTLTLTAQPTVRRGIVCCDVPEAALSALREYRSDVTEVTHDMTQPQMDFSLRMTHAEELLAAYASAEMVFTRRLHCAMACLAVGTPVLLLYHDDYEDVSRFAPMDAMVRSQPLDAFVQQVQRRGIPTVWKNPADMARIRRTILDALQAGIERARTVLLPIVPAAEAEEWRRSRTQRMVDSASQKIARLENERYEALHAKFDLLLREDGVKSTVEELMALPG